jgi:hypothetical protein
MTPPASWVARMKLLSRTMSPKPEMVLQSRTRVEAGNDVTQAFPISQLAKAQSQKMIIGRKTPGVAPHRELLGTPGKSMVVETSDNLGKYGFKDRHRRLYRL